MGRVGAKPGRENPMWRPALERFAEKCQFDAATERRLRIKAEVESMLRYRK